MDTGLPRLPLPSLTATCERFLEWASPLVAADAAAEARLAVSDLLAGDGPSLQRALADAAAQTPAGYLHDLWRDRYLANRLPLAPNQNVAGVLDGAPPGVPIARWTAAVMVAMADFCLRVRRGTLTPDRIGRQTLGMEQYPYLFGTARQPQAVVDRVMTDRGSSHMVVVHRGRFHRVTVLIGDAVVPIDALERAVANILSRADAPASPVGVLTSLPRTEWAHARERLAAVCEGNAAALAGIDSALTLICLDGAVGAGREALAANALLGDGSNRWFDKSMQVVITAEGTFAGNLEHSMVDGLPMVRLALESGQMAAALAATAPATWSEAVDVEPLDWTVTPEVQHLIEDAAARYASLREGHELRVCDVETGAVAFARAGVNADAAVQLALQLAYVRQHGEPAIGYEPVPMRHFAFGRTEGLRPVTAEALSFLAAMQRGESAAMPLLHAAVAAHLDRRGECERGEGVERHLFAIAATASRASLTPTLFESVAYRRCFQEEALSTSAVPPVPGLQLFAFGPPSTAAPAYGIAYVTRPRRVSLTVTSRTGDASAFTRAAADAVRDLAALLGEQV